MSPLSAAPSALRPAPIDTVYPGLQLPHIGWLHTLLEYDDLGTAATACGARLPVWYFAVGAVPLRNAQLVLVGPQRSWASPTGCRAGHIACMAPFAGPMMGPRFHNLFATCCILWVVDAAPRCPVPSLVCLVCHGLLEAG